MGNCCKDILAYVDGNDVLLRLGIYVRTDDGEQPVDLEACDSVKACVYNLDRHKRAPVEVETAVDSSEEGALVAHLPRTLTNGLYGLAVEVVKNGSQARSFDIRFKVVERDKDAYVPLTAVDGALTASLHVTMQVISQAAVRGQNAYEMWKELPGNQDKTLQEYIDGVLDLSGMASRFAAAEQVRDLSERGRTAGETNRMEAEAQREAVAAADHERAESDHGRAESDHAAAGTDHETSGADHERAESDHGRAESDHVTAGADHETAAADHGRAESDHERAESDHATAGTDHATAGADHRAALDDRDAVADAIGRAGVAADNADAKAALAEGKAADAAAAAGNAYDTAVRAEAAAASADRKAARAEAAAAAADAKAAQAGEAAANAEGMAGLARDAAEEAGMVNAVLNGNILTVTSRKGISSSTNVKGNTGAPGVGIARGGTRGQVLAKASDTDYVTEWIDPSGGYEPPEGGIPKNDLSADVKKSLRKADTALQQESDPTVPAWAKQPQKPSYTASEVGALPADTPLFSGSYNDLTDKPEVATVIIRNWN